MDENFKNYVTFADKVIENGNEDPNEDKLDQLHMHARKDYERKKKQNNLNLQVLNMKLFEAFLESGPQSAVQIMIIMKNGVSDRFQLFTLFTSFLSFSKTATKLYLEYPTAEVTCCLLYTSPSPRD